MKSSFISIRNLPSCKNFARNKSKFVLIVIFASALLMFGITSYYFLLLFSPNLSSLPSAEELVKDLIFTKGVSAQNDPIVVNYLINHHLISPNFGTDYNLTNILNPQQLDINVQSALRHVFGGRIPENGFFVECGANDGEFLSNTIQLEMELGWTGLLIEGSPSLVKSLTNTNRKAWVADVCLSGEKPIQVDFLRHANTFPPWSGGAGKIKERKTTTQTGNGIEKATPTNSYGTDLFTSEGVVECFPLYAILSAINVSRVDLLSLDVEGHEYQILKAVPFHSVDIKVIFVEYFLAPEGEQGIKTLLAENGFKLWAKTGSDMVFVNKQTDYVSP